MAYNQKNIHQELRVTVIAFLMLKLKYTLFCCTDQTVIDEEFPKDERDRVKLFNLESSVLKEIKLYHGGEVVVNFCGI